MPTLSFFYGVQIQMFWNDHAPPHFHATYGEHEALVDIRTLAIMEGTLPPRAWSLVMEWGALHQKDLLGNWELCTKKQPPLKIPPLD